MGLFEKITIDPNIFTGDDKNVLALTTLYLRFLNRRDPKNYFRLVYDRGSNESELKQYYTNLRNQISSGVGSDFLKDMLQELETGAVVSRDETEEIVPKLPLPDEIQTLFSSPDELSPIHQILVGMAFSYPNLTILLADPGYWQNGLYKNDLRDKVCKLLKREAFIYISDYLIRPTLIKTEGKTDWKHLKAALRALRQNEPFVKLKIKFDEFESDSKKGSPELIKFCEQASQRPSDDPVICIFDRDEDDIIKLHLFEKDEKYKTWDNKLYSFLIPLPPHRKDLKYACIELYYSDAEITTKDKNGRRLFLSSEFSPKSGRHKYQKNLQCNDKNKLKCRSQSICIIDGSIQVLDLDNPEEPNVALPKNRFAEYILQEKPEFHDEPNFKNFNFSAFAAIFEVIALIIEEKQLEWK